MHDYMIIIYFYNNVEKRNKNYQSYITENKIQLLKEQNNQICRKI